MASLGGIQQLAAENPAIYYGASVGYVIASPVVGIARLALTCYQWLKLPSSALYEEVRNNKNIKDLTFYRSLDGAKDFLKGQAVRAVIEIFSWFVGAFALLLRDLAYARPSSRNHIENPRANAPFTCNIGGFDEINEMKIWTAAVKTEVDKFIQNEKKKNETPEPPPQ